MLWSFKLLNLFIILLLCNGVSLLNNGLALKPPLGWMSWGYYECGDECEIDPSKCLDEKLIMSVADEFYNKGYIDVGYEYIVIDDCWSEKKRDENGRLVPDRKRFPRGMKFLADYIHARGLKFGMYTNIAKTTCKGYPGSRDHFDVDAKTFANWEIDYLKVDGCFVDEDFLNTAYIKLGKYLNETGRPIVYACSWPYYIQFISNHTPNLEAVAQTCNVFRNYHDIFPFWGNVLGILEFYEAEYKNLEKYHKSGQWFDPDMLLIGRDELPLHILRVQLVFFNMLSAPLMLSCDLSKIMPSHKELILNAELMAIGQDPLALPPKPYKLSPKVTLWVKARLPMKGDKYPTYSLAFINTGSDTEIAVAKLRDYGLNYTDGYDMQDMFETSILKYRVTLDEPIVVTITQQDVAVYSFYPIQH